MKIKLIIVFLYLFHLHSYVTADEIKVGVFIHSPIVFQNPKTKEAYGPGVDYIKAVITEMGHSADVMILPMSRMILYLKIGAIDMGLEVGKTEARTVFLYYSDLPVYYSKPAIAVLKGNKLDKINTINDLKGMTIGYLLGAFQGNFFNNSAAVKFDLVSADEWLKQNLAKLIAKRVDAVLDQNAYSLVAEARSMGIEKKIKLLYLPVDMIEGYAIFSKKSPNSIRWLQEFNSVNRSGKYNENRMIEDYLNTINIAIP